MCDAALEVLGILFLAIERMGLLPHQFRVMIFSLLVKPQGGFCPKLGQPCIMRIYEKARRKHIAQYMADTERRYYFVAKGQSCVDVFWRQVAFVEAAVAHGDCVAAFACDGDQF